MGDQSVFRGDLGNVLQFKREVVDWARRWRPGPAAVSATQRAPLEVLCARLGPAVRLGGGRQRVAGLVDQPAAGHE
eukprot:622018-Alexandrium_andersonii.AAC.1